MLRPFLYAMLIFCILPSARAEDPEPSSDDHLGQGWTVPGTDFRLGGYASAAAQKPRHRPWNASAKDLSLFTWWEGDSPFSFFSELDLEDGLTWTAGHDVTTRHAYLALERLYGDYHFSDSINARAGKFLTPVGRWNTIHADPLVWTTSRPLITERAFPTNATGVMLYGNLPAFGKSIDYSVYTALGKEWLPNPKLDPFNEAYGLHLNLPLQELGEFGFSYVNFEQRQSIGERRNLLGVDYFGKFKRYEFNVEAIYRLSDEGQNATERGMFVQGLAPLSQRLYLVGRYEWFDPAGSLRPVNLGLIGLAWKPTPSTVIKAEYSRAKHNTIHAPDGFYTSFAILF